MSFQKANELKQGKKKIQEIQGILIVIQQNVVSGAWRVRKIREKWEEKLKKGFILRESSAKSSLSHKQHKEETLNKKYNLNQTSINLIEHNKSLKCQQLGIGQQQIITIYI